jgi:hypothetical protein
MALRWSHQRSRSSIQVLVSELETCSKLPVTDTSKIVRYHIIAELVDRRWHLAWSGESENLHTTRRHAHVQIHRYALDLTPRTIRFSLSTSCST